MAFKLTNLSSPYTLLIILLYTHNAILSFTHERSSSLPKAQQASKQQASSHLYTFSSLHEYTSRRTGKAITLPSPSLVRSSLFSQQQKSKPSVSFLVFISFYNNLYISEVCKIFQVWRNCIKLLYVLKLTIWATCIPLVLFLPTAAGSQSIFSLIVHLAPFLIN